MRIPTKKPAPGQTGVIIRNVAPIRKEPEMRAEQISQALIGETVTVEAGAKDWLYVQTWDTYRGWISESAVRMIEDQCQPYASTGPVAVMRELFVDIYEKPSERSRIITKATIAAEIEVTQTTSDWPKLLLPDGKTGFIHRSEAKLIDKSAGNTIWLLDPQRLIETAERFIGVPYLWGGTSPFGIDCSGFMQLVHRIHSVTLLRDAYMQAGDPRMVRVDREDLRAGDMVFFGKDKEPNVESISHVGMMINQHEFIHSSGACGVTISPLDDPYYSSIYWGARRLRLETMDTGGRPPED